MSRNSICDSSFSDEDDHNCPLCLEELDATDQSFNSCQCGYQVCLWCWHQIKNEYNGLCPACRAIYKEPAKKKKSPPPKLKYTKSTREERGANSSVSTPKVRKKNTSTTSAALSSSGSQPLPPVGTTVLSTALRKSLTSVRVVQSNLVYVIGLPLSFASEEKLRRLDCFGLYGKMIKVVVNKAQISDRGTASTASAYVTFVKADAASKCIEALDNFLLDGRLVRASFGTTKYCNFFLRNTSCSNPECLYLHELGQEVDSYTKEEMMQSGKTSFSQVVPVPEDTLPRSGLVFPAPPSSPTHFVAPLTSHSAHMLAARPPSTHNNQQTHNLLVDTTPPQTPTASFANLLSPSSSSSSSLLPTSEQRQAQSAAAINRLRQSISPRTLAASEGSKSLSLDASSSPPPPQMIISLANHEKTSHTSRHDPFQFLPSHGGASTGFESEGWITPTLTSAGSFSSGLSALSPSSSRPSMVSSLAPPSEAHVDAHGRPSPPFSLSKRRGRVENASSIDPPPPSSWEQHLMDPLLVPPLVPSPHKPMPITGPRRSKVGCYTSSSLESGPPFGTRATSSRVRASPGPALPTGSSVDEMLANLLGVTLNGSCLAAQASESTRPFESSSSSFRREEGIPPFTSFSHHSMDHPPMPSTSSRDTSGLAFLQQVLPNVNCSVGQPPLPNASVMRPLGGLSSPSFSQQRYPLSSHPVPPPLPPGLPNPHTSYGGGASFSGHYPPPLPTSSPYHGQGPGQHRPVSISPPTDPAIVTQGNVCFQVRGMNVPSHLTPHQQEVGFYNNHGVLPPRPLASSSPSWK